MYRNPTGRLAEDGYIFGIASKRGNVLAHPLEGGDLVHVRIVALRLFRMLLAQRGKREETEAPKTVVKSDQNDALLGELATGKVRTGSAAEHEGTAVDPHHDRQFGSRLGPSRLAHIEKQAIFRRVLANRIT